MSNERNAASDPVRSMSLLWRVNIKQGRSGLTLEKIIDDGVGIADGEGLDALSMRRLADVLGAGTMSLYTHIPGKGELVDLMLDTVLGELYAGDPPASQSGGWRGALQF